MKKLLIATTALVATAGMASAEVVISGAARAGIKYVQDNVVGTDSKETFLTQRTRVNFDAKATSDSGVSFQSRIRMQGDGNNGTTGNAGLNAPRFSAEAGGLRVDIGNAGGAIDNMPNYYGAYETGLTGFTGQYSGASYGFAGYSSGGGNNPTIYGRYAAGGFATALSFRENAPDGDGTTDEAQLWDIHVAYTFDAFTAAIGYGSTDDVGNMTVLTLGYGAGAFNVSGLVGTESFDDAATDTANGGTFYGLAATYDVSPALTIGVNYGDGEGDADAQAYGIGATYSLGGGVSIRGGIGSNDDTSIADLGVNFSF